MPRNLLAPAAGDAENRTSEGGLEFPCVFPIKVMGLSGEALSAAVGNIVLRHAPDFDLRTMEERASRAGRYLSLTCTIKAVSQAQLDALYRELSSHPRVKLVL